MYNYFKDFQKVAKNSKRIVRSSKKSTMLISYKRALYDFKKIELKPYEEMHLTLIILKIHKFAKNSKIFRSSKKAQTIMLISYRRALYNFKTIK